MGRIPVFLHEDYSWAPYHGTNLSAEHFGFVTKNDPKEIDYLLDRIMNMSDSEYLHRLTALEDARYHYTYDGVMHQLEMFFNDPFGENDGNNRGGNVKCLDEHPKHWT